MNRRIHSVWFNRTRSQRLWHSTRTWNWSFVHQFVRIDVAYVWLMYMSSLYEWQVISTLLLVPGFMKLNPNWQSKWTHRKSHKHFVVINQWIWGFQIFRQPLSDDLTSTFCRAWIPAISAVWGEAISAVIGSPANRSHQVSLSCFGWFSETNRLCFAKSDGTARSCKRPEIYIKHNITQLRNYIVI